MIFDPILRLAESGHEVWGARRRSELIPAPIKAIKTDLHDPSSIKLPAMAWEAVFVILTATAFNDESYRQTYVLGVRNLLARLKTEKDRPRRLILVSSIIVAVGGGDSACPGPSFEFAAQGVLVTGFFSIGADF